MNCKVCKRPIENEVAGADVYHFECFKKAVEAASSEYHKALEQRLALTQDDY